MLLLLLTTYIPQGNVEQNQLTAKVEGNKRNNTGQEKNNILKYYPTKLRLWSNHNDFYCLCLRENIATPRKWFSQIFFSNVVFRKQHKTYLEKEESKQDSLFANQTY